MDRIDNKKDSVKAMPALPILVAVLVFWGTGNYAKGKECSELFKNDPHSLRLPRGVTIRKGVSAKLLEELNSEPEIVFYEGNLWKAIQKEAQERGLDNEKFKLGKTLRVSLSKKDPDYLVLTMEYHEVTLSPYPKNGEIDIRVSRKVFFDHVNRFGKKTNKHYEITITGEVKELLQNTSLPFICGTKTSEEAKTFAETFGITTSLIDNQMPEGLKSGVGRAIVLDAGLSGVVKGYDRSLDITKIVLESVFVDSAGATQLKLILFYGENNEKIYNVTLEPDFSFYSKKMANAVSNLPENFRAVFEKSLQ